MKTPQAEMPEGVSMPKTPEELQAFKDQYPEVFEVVQTVSSIQAESQLSELRQELGTIKEREKELEKQKAYEELLRLHPDFDELKDDEKFLGWLSEQPESISDGIYRNNTDARWAARVLDLYKADTGQTKKRTKSKNSAADAVTRNVAREVKTASGSDKIWKASEIGKMKPWEFEKVEAELDAARAEGRIDYNN
jgi:multidrug efflux pump subunit AcrB